MKESDTEERTIKFTSDGRHFTATAVGCSVSDTNPEDAVRNLFIELRKAKGRLMSVEPRFLSEDGAKTKDALIKFFL